MKLLLLLLFLPATASAQLRGQSEKLTTFEVGLEVVPTKTAYAVMTFGVKYRERRIVMPARLLYRNDLIGGSDELNVMFGMGMTLKRYNLYLWGYENHKDNRQL